MRRRSSVIAPLLIIVIGAIFLLRNFFPEIPVGELIGRYWPFLLIIWGGLRLVEIAFWAFSAAPLPRNGVSGGEWVLVFFICIIGSAAYSARHHFGWMPDGNALRGMMVDFGESYEYNTPEQTKAAGRAPRIILESFRGSAHITGSDANEVKVSGRKTIRSFQQKDADQADKETPIELVARDQDVIIRTNQDRVNDRQRVSDDLEISVPKGATVEAHGRYGDFDISGVNGNVDVTSDNAGVRLQNIAGNVRIDLRKSDVIRATGVKGSVELKGRGDDVELQDIGGQVTIAGTYLGEVQLRDLSQPVRYDDSQVQFNAEKIPGQVRLNTGQFTADNVVGPIRVRARARDVQMTDFTQSVDLTLDRGDVEFRSLKLPLPKMDVQIRSGDIDLAMPSAAKFDLHMGTERGEAHNDFGTALRIEEAHHGALIVGQVAQGPVLNLSTGRGTVTIRKAGPGDETEEADAAAEKPARPAPTTPAPPSTPELRVQHQ